MKINRTNFLRLLSVLVVVAAVLLLTVSAEDGSGSQSSFYGTAWSLLPPIIAIVLAFITKEVYSSLFIGIVAGAVLYSDFNILRTVEHIVEIISTKLGANGGINIFLVILGIIVAMMERSGCSAAYGAWVHKRIKSKTGALVSTTILGIMLFVDDYFNCLTTGNVMRPVTDTHKVSRARLAYNIDCTAAPICIIAPVSSWAAAVSGYIPEQYNHIDGLMLFIRAIPFNYYALLTITMLFALAFLKFDWGPMVKYEKMAEEEGDIYGGTGNLYAEASSGAPANPKGTVVDMILPVIILIVCCVFGLMYTGGFFDGGVSIVEAFGNCDAFVGLPIGGLVALVLIIGWYFVRKVVSPKDFVDCIPDGFTLMVPAMLILTFSWGLEGVCNLSLGSATFVHNFMESSVFPQVFLPVILYIIGAFISFATGTAWGTFGIMIPIVLAIFGGQLTPICIISISAALSGAVSGDHCSPISETAIMSSTAAQVDFMQHVMTQLPYAIFIMVNSAIGFLLAGLLQNVIVLPIVIVMVIAELFVIKKVGAKSGFARTRIID